TSAVMSFSTSITKEMIKDAQENDGELMNIVENLNEHQYYSLTDDGVLLYQDGKYPLKSVVIPDKLIDSILKEYHDNGTSGHFGFAKTLARMKGTVWFPRMRDKTKNYCTTCHQCQIYKTSNKLPSGLLHPIQSKEPNEIHFLDLIGPLPRGIGGNEYAMVLYDHFTKFVFIEPLVSANSKAIMNKLTKIYGLTGYPKRLVTDNAKYFTSKVFKGIAESMGIELRFISPYKASSNSCER